MLKSRERGFTLAELMVTVAIVGVLAVIGVASFRSEIGASKTNEAAAVIQAIRAAQEAYRSENQSYLNVSSAADSWYPKDDFTSKLSWTPNEDYSDHERWALLGASVAQPVIFRFLVNAGGAGSTFPTPTVGITLPTSITTARDEPWYLIQARADADGDEVYCDGIATSLNNEVVFKNEGE